MQEAIDDAWEYSGTRLYDAIDYLQEQHGAEYLSYYPRHTWTPEDFGYSPELFGKWRTTTPNRIFGWATGFWPGCLWLQWQKTGDSNMLAAAKDWTAGIEPVATNPLDHDLGFRFMTSFRMGYGLLDDTTDPGGVWRNHARDVLLTAAGTLNSRFNNAGIPAGLIEAVGRNGWLAPYGVVVDSMMNVSLLFEGYELSGRPATGPARQWYENGITHANTIIEQHLRRFDAGDPRANDDGSTYHGSTHYDNSTYTPLPQRNDPNSWGDLYYKMTAQGYSDETTWSRGQAWSLYGFAQVYAYTRDDPAVQPERFLDTACRNANYFISHLPHYYTADDHNHRLGDFAPPTDFDAALGEAVGPWNDANNDKVYGDRRAGTHALVARDSSAAAIAASGLLLLSTLVTDEDLREEYFLAAEDILWCLMTYDGDGDSQLDYLGKDSVHMGILANARGGYSSQYGNSFIFGDFYFLEALTRYEALNRDLLISLAADYDWVYQNTPVTTLDRHHCVLTVTITQEARAGESYAAGFTENGGPLTNFTVQTTANPLVWNLVGGRVGSSTPSAPALRTIGVTLTGSQSGKSASASVQVALRLLGDIDGNGLVGLTDKVQMNKKLNGLDTAPYTDRNFDLTGDGAVGLTDKVQINRVLNGLAIP